MADHASSPDADLKAAAKAVVDAGKLADGHASTGMSEKTLREWAQGKNHPEGAGSRQRFAKALRNVLKTK